MTQLNHCFEKSLPKLSKGSHSLISKKGGKARSEARVTQWVESLPSKPPAAKPSVNPAETDVKRVPASGVKGGEQGEKMNEPKVREPDMNNPEERDRVERVKGALNILTYGNEQPPGAPDHTLSWGLSQWKIIARADGQSEKTVEGVEGAIKLLQDFPGDIPLTAVTSQKMRRFVIALKQRLRGQLNFIQPSTSLNEPQAQWVGLYPNPTHYRRKCPIHKVQRALASQKGIRLKIAAGGVWVCHRYDTDPYPGRPHAHNMETGEKLHLGSGEIFRPGSRIAKGKLAEKHLHVIRDTISKKWPDITLPSMLP